MIDAAGLAGIEPAGLDDITRRLLQPVPEAQQKGYAPEPEEPAESLALFF